MSVQIDLTITKDSVFSNRFFPKEDINEFGILYVKNNNDQTTVSVFFQNKDQIHKMIETLFQLDKDWIEPTSVKK